MTAPLNDVGPSSNGEDSNKTTTDSPGRPDTAGFSCSCYKSWKRSVVSVMILITVIVVQSFMETSYQLSSMKSPASVSSTNVTGRVPISNDSSNVESKDGWTPTVISPPAETTTSISLDTTTVSQEARDIAQGQPVLQPHSSTSSSSSIRPVVQADDDCVPFRKPHKLHRVDSFPVYSKFDDFVDGDGSPGGLLYSSFLSPNSADGTNGLQSSPQTPNSNKKNHMTILYAICEFQDIQHSQHFTHAMQQLYGCWSFWQFNSFNTDDNVDKVQPVLLMTSGVERKLTKNAFLRGFLDALQNRTIHSRESNTIVNKEMNLLITGRAKFLEEVVNNNTTNTIHVISNYPPQEEQENTAAAQTSRVYDKTTLPSVHISVKGGYTIVHDVHNLRQVVRSHYSIQGLNDFDHNGIDRVTSGNGDNRVKASPTRREPRIAILNRRKSVGRSILNAERLAEMLTKRLYNTTTADRNSKENIVPVMYFEGKSFQEQVSFFSNVDILISPHGAQLTGLPFMGPSSSTIPCGDPRSRTTTSGGAVLELFPKGYLIPDFFGSLATHSGLSYGYMYLSDGDNPSTEQAENLLNRINARSANLCPQMATVVEAVKRLAEEWKEARKECT